jgi:nitroreductase
MPDIHVPAQPVAPEAALYARYGTGLPLPSTWNATLDILLAHRSVRAYLPDAVPPDTVDLMVAAAQSASSSSNLQVWSVAVVEDRARKARLAELAAGQGHIVAAPLFMVWLADLANTGLDALPFIECFLMAAIDAALAAQNAVTAAESLGLGTCYIGAVRNKPEEIAAELGLPPHVMAVFGLCVGYPDPAAGATVKPRLPQSVVVHREQYSEAQEVEGIAAYDNRLRAFQEATAMKPVGWSSTVMSRLRSAESLTGRHRLREALGHLGFELR